MARYLCCVKTLFLTNFAIILWNLKCWRVRWSMQGHVAALIDRHLGSTKTIIGKVHLIMLKSIIKSTTVAATLLGGLIVAPQFATAQTANPAAIDGWFKQCDKQADNDICIVQNNIVAQSGQLITAVGFIEITGKSNQRLLQISTPTARLIQPGISIQVDGGKQIKVPYTICLPDKCLAQIQLSDEAIANSFKKGGEVVFTSVNAQRAANPIRISLGGFTQAYDGEAIGRAEQEEKVKAREDEIRKKLEESRAKLQAAQDAAKKAAE
jgi:invasion protein IalB